MLNYDDEQLNSCSYCTNPPAYFEDDMQNKGGRAMAYNFEAMRQIEIDTVKTETLVDVTKIQIDTDLPQQERLVNLIAEVGNPYLFLVGNTPVKVRFAPDGENLSTCLEHYFSSVQAVETGGR